MPTKQIPEGCFSVANLAKDLRIDPRLARGRLRKAMKDEDTHVPPCEKGPHNHNESWIFLNKHKKAIIKLITPEGPSKKSKVEEEATEAAEDLAAE